MVPEVTKDPGPEWRLVEPIWACEAEGCEDAGIWARRHENGTRDEHYCDLHQEIADEQEAAS